jgi:hypothetical protein
VVDHGGLPAGSEIRLGVVSFPPPTPPDSGGAGSPPPPPPPVPSKRHHHRPPKAAHHRAKAHRTRHRSPTHVLHPAQLPRLGAGVRAGIVRAAEDQIGWPYIWGGESRAEGGFDCSGLVDYAYSAAGHPLPGRPTAAVLWQMGMPIARDQLRPGDLAFLGAGTGAPYHVGLYAGHGIVVVASGRRQPIEAVPLDSVPWDGYARIWANGSAPAAAEQPTTASHRDAPLAVSALRADATAAARVIQARLITVERMNARVPNGVPQRETRGPTRPRPRHSGAAAVTVADVRVRIAPARQAGSLPSA